MASYYVNKEEQKNGDHEVHVASCSYLPGTANRLYLGEFDNCEDAVAAAMKIYPQSNGCYFCCYECHTT